MIDAEWLALMMEAKSIGLTPEDIRDWIESKEEEGVQ